MKIRKQEKRHQGRDLGGTEKRPRIEEAKVDTVTRNGRKLQKRTLKGKEGGESRLEEWLKAYGITKETSRVNGREGRDLQVYL